MGRGSKPYETGVRKRLTNYSRTSNGGGVGGSPNNSIDKCLFSINLDIKITNKNHIIAVGDPVALIPTSRNKLEIFIKSIRIQDFNGLKKQLVLNCIADGYIYTGEVVSAETDGGELMVSVIIHGHGR